MARGSDPDSRAVMIDRLRRSLRTRLRASSLGTKLAVLGALLTASVVGGTFAVLRIGTDRSVRRVFVTELGASQRALRRIEDNDRHVLLQRALLVANSRALHAALDATGADSGVPILQAEQISTISGEAFRLFQGLGADLLLITNDRGRVVAATGRVMTPAVGTSMQSLPALRWALSAPSPASDSTFGVITVHTLPLEVAAVPVLVNGVAVGAIVLGKRIDQIMPADSTSDTQQIVASDTMVLMSSLRRAPAGSSWHPGWTRVDSTASTLVINGEEYVVATVPLGLGSDARAVDLYLLRSLSAAIGPIERALTRRFLFAGLLAVLLVGGGAAVLSRTTLRPLSRFVTAMESGTRTQSYARFAEPDAPSEITALTDSYNRLIESLEYGNTQLQMRTVDLAKANHRLNRQIGRRELAEQALRESEEQLRQAQKLEALGALAGGVAHDFNNILSIILGYAEIVQSELEVGSPVHVDAGKISDAAVRARALVRQLLAFSRKQVLQPQILDLNAVVAGVQPLLRPLIGEDVALEVCLAGDLAMVTADPGQIEQVIINLAVNARDAMPGGGKLRIETSNTTLESRGGEYPMLGGAVVMLAVTDTGIGMDAATRRRIFEPFFTTKPVGKGTGLGLATVYGIVRQSEGNITVFSEPGEGTVFRCYFPTASTPSTAEQPRASAGTPPRGAETILIAEDETELRELMRRGLQRQGYSVLAAVHGADALRIAAAHDGPIHLLITDVVMPEMSGKELAERLVRERAGLRVVFISGYSNEAIAHHGVLTPDSVFLEKPVSPETLTNAVRELLDAESVIAT